jgi:hypothetical protein
MQYISNGNGKLNKGFLCVNMGDFESICKNNPIIMDLCECYEDCYTNPDNSMYKSNPKIREAWINSTAFQISKHIIQRIKRRRVNIVEYIRFNERGEVLEQSDIIKAYEICRLIPDYQFTIYTTRCDLDWRGKPDNLVLIESGHRNIPERTKSKIAGAKDVDYICDWHRTGKKCNQGCTHCYTKKKEDISIIIH